MSPTVQALHDVFLLLDPAHLVTPCKPRKIRGISRQLLKRIAASAIYIKAFSYATARLLTSLFSTSIGFYTPALIALKSCVAIQPCYSASDPSLNEGSSFNEGSCPKLTHFRHCIFHSLHRNNFHTRDFLLGCIGLGDDGVGKTQLGGFF